MALFVQLRDVPVLGNPGLVHNPTLEWHTGEGLFVRPSEVRHVEYVQADGHELQHIYNNFQKIPKAPYGTRVVQWWGDHAKFIVANLRDA